MVEVSFCSHRSILQPCSLEGYAFQLDPYIGCHHHCYYCYALNQAETDWDREVQIHQNFIGQLHDELSMLEPQSIYIGWNSDAYQPSEGKYKQTRKALELLAEQGFSVCVLTKSSLVTRDIDLFARIPGTSVGISIAFQNDRSRRLFEVNTQSNYQRIDTLKTLHEAGIRTYILICPVMPFITDVKQLIDQVSPYVDTIWVYALNIDSEEDRNWQNIKKILECHFPELVREYREIALRSEHPYWVRLRTELELLQKKSQLNLRIEL